jgi:anti-anti-sigma factor
MNITESSRNNISIFALDGRINSQSAAMLEETLQTMSATGNVRMILDLSAVTYISSSGLRTLAAILTQNRGSGGDLLLVTPTRKIQRVFQIIGFDNFFNMFDTVESAVQAF